MQSYLLILSPNQGACKVRTAFVHMYSKLRSWMVTGKKSKTNLVRMAWFGYSPAPYQDFRDINVRIIYVIYLKS